jgi:hypothetical protein
MSLRDEGFSDVARSKWNKRKQFDKTRGMKINKPDGLGMK